MTKAKSDFHESLERVYELVQFIHKLSHSLSASALKPGQDLAKQAARRRVKLPKFLDGATLTYEKHSPERGVKGRSIVVVTPPITPPKPGPLYLKIFCVRIRIRNRIYVVCLECGWIWCKIVIYF